MLSEEEKKKTDDVWALYYKVLAKVWRAIGHSFKPKSLDNEDKIVVANMVVAEVIEGLRKMLNADGYNYSFKEYLSMIEGTHRELEKEKSSLS